MKMEDFKTPMELENLAWLKETFLDGLQELGFDLVDYQDIEHIKGECGSHSILLEEKPELIPIVSPDRKDDYQRLIDICTQDDDGQPCATYRYYCGSLFLYIPYFA